MQKTSLLPNKGVSLVSLWTLEEELLLVPHVSELHAHMLPWGEVSGASGCQSSVCSSFSFLGIFRQGIYSFLGKNT